MSSPLAAAKHALRELARRGQRLQVEIRELERVMTSLTAEIDPAMVEAFGIGRGRRVEIGCPPAWRSAVLQGGSPCPPMGRLACPLSLQALVRITTAPSKARAGDKYREDGRPSQVAAVHVGPGTCSG